MTECLAEVGYTPEVRRLAEEVTGTPKATDSISAEGKPRMVAWHEEIYAVTDCLGICAFTDTWSYTRVNFENMAAMFSAATGIPVSAAEARRIGERIITLERLFNLREGLTRDQLDVLPQRMMSGPSPTLRGGERTLTPEKLDGMLREYYALRRWDTKSGVPLRDTLARLDLDFAAEDVVGAR